MTTDSADPADSLDAAGVAEVVAALQEAAEEEARREGVGGVTDDERDQRIETALKTWLEEHAEQELSGWTFEGKPFAWIDVDGRPLALLHAEVVARLEEVRARRIRRALRP
jgi:hypothetical protein